MDQQSEQDLIARAASGDDLAAHRLLLLHHDRIAALIAKKIPRDLASLMAAEDVCQEAYVVAVRDIEQFEHRGERSFFNWLMTIAERKLIDSVRALRALKRGGGRKALDLPITGEASSMIMLLEQVAVHERTPSRSVADHELAAAMQTALANLSDDHQTALRARFLEGLTAAEIGQRMGRSEGGRTQTVRTRAETTRGEHRRRFAVFEPRRVGCGCSFSIRNIGCRLRLLAEMKQSPV